MSKRILLIILALGIAGLWLNTPVQAGHRWGHSSTNVSTHDSGAWDDCQARYDISFDDQEAYRAQEQQTLARSSFSTLRVHDLKNGGMAVHGWDKPDVQVTVKDTRKKAKSPYVQQSVTPPVAGAAGGASR